MHNLIKFELYKFIRQKSFYVCAIVSLGIYLLFSLLGYFFSDTVTTNGIIELIASPAASDLTLFFAIIIANLVCKDYQELAIRTVVSKGNSRSAVYISKFIVSMLSSLIFIGLTWIVAFVFGSIVGGVGSTGSVNLFHIIVAQLFYALAYSAMFFCFSIIFRKTGSAIALCIVVPIMVPLVAGGIDHLAKLDIKFSKLMLSYYTSDIFSLNATSVELNNSIRFSILYFVVFIIIGWIATKDREV